MENANHVRFAELEEQFERFDSLDPALSTVPLNRTRIGDFGDGDLSEHQHAIEHGTVPIRRQKPVPDR